MGQYVARKRGLTPFSCVPFDRVCFGKRGLSPTEPCACSTYDVEGDMTVTAPDAVGGEIIAVDCEDFLQGEAFCRYDQRGIGEIHRRVGVLHHQVKGTNERLIVKKENLQTASGNEVHQGRSTGARRTQQVECLGENGDGRRHRLINSLECLNTSSVCIIGAVEQRHQRPGIGQDHRPYFFLIVSETKSFALVAGPMA